MTDQLPRLTLKQDGFLRSFMESGVAIKAYREHYGTDKQAQATAHANASRLLNNSKIKAHLEYERARKDVKRMEIEEIARQHASEALQTLVSIANDPKAPTSSRVAAAGAVLDRAHGKPISKTELDATLNRRSAGVEEMSEDELLAAISPKGEG